MHIYKYIFCTAYNIIDKIWSLFWTESLVWFVLPVCVDFPTKWRDIQFLTAFTRPVPPKFELAVQPFAYSSTMDLKGLELKLGVDTRKDVRD